MNSPSPIILVGKMESRTECKKGRQEEKKEVGEKEAKRERGKIFPKPWSFNQIIF